MLGRRLPPTPISDLAADTQVVVEGRIVACDQVMVAGDGSRCVYLDLMRETWRKGVLGRGRPAWWLESWERTATGFQLEDASGNAWIDVDVDRLDVRRPRRVVWHEDSSNRRCVGRMLKLGEAVHVRGVAYRRPPEDGGGIGIRAPDEGLLQIRARRP